MSASSTWHIGPIATPSLHWGAVRGSQIHCCPTCCIPLLTGETPGFCCGPRGSKFNDVPPLPPLPQEYNIFLNDPNVSSLSRILNLVFSFASLETTQEFPNISGGHAFIAIQGKVYHRIRPNHNDSAIRWLLHDGFMQHRAPHASWASKLPATWKNAFTAALLRVNPLVQALQNLSALSIDIPNAHLILQDSGSASEIAAIMSYENTSQNQVKSRRLIISRTSGANQTIPTVSRLWEPLAYPLLFPHATLGWGLPHTSDNLTQNVAVNPSTPTTQIWHYRARLLREARFRIFGRLTNEYVVDMFSRDIESRLQYIRRNQQRLRLEDEALMNDPDLQPSENVYLPASFLGSKRWSSEQIADSLTIASNLGTPTFFITMTCNPDWPEITSQLRPGQDFTDVPVVVVRVFKRKLALLLQTLKSMFPNAGTLKYCIHCVEFQKRGLPHAHILVKYASDCINPSDIDDVVSAEIPADPIDAALVTRFMVHNHPSPSAPPAKYCQKVSSNGSRTCRFHYPFPLQDSTTIDTEGKVHYRRRRPGDEMVVPHCLPLLRKFKCHINFEVANTSHIFQYIFKYIHKGPDTARYNIRKDPTLPIDEIEDFWKARYLSAGEATWRILGFHVTQKVPSVTALPIHLPGSNRQQQYSRGNGSESKLSLLDRYFHRPLGNFTHTNIVRAFDSLTYLEYHALFRLEKYLAENDARPLYYAEQQNSANSPRMHAVLCASTIPHLTRIQPLRPSNGDAFYLRTILQNRPARSFVDARSVNGLLYETFQDAAKELGLFADQDESTLTLLEAINSLRTPAQLRFLFVDLLVNDCVHLPLATWHDFAEHLSYDFILRNGDLTDIGQALALSEISSHLREHGKDLVDYGLPILNAPPLEALQEIQHWGLNANGLMERASRLYESFNPGQKEVFDLIWDAHANSEPLLLFIDGKAGTGKTTLITVLCDALRGSGCIILPTATSAFAAQLYPGGRTTHSTFKISVAENNEMISSSIQSHDSRAALIREASVITWDEALMTNKAVLACMEEVCQQAMGNDAPFGNKIIILLGDFRQTCPVVKKGTKSQVIDASIKSSPLWPLFRVVRLTELIRNAQDPDFASFVNSVGDGTSGSSVLLTDYMQKVGTQEQLIDFVFPDNILSNPEVCVTRAILAPTNALVDIYNHHILERLSGESRLYLAADSLKESEDADIVPSASVMDYIGRKPPVGLPPSQLLIRVGGIYRILRNFSLDRGLVKNARVLIVAVGVRLISVRLLKGNMAPDPFDEDILLPRITFTASLPSRYTLVRRQFPLGPAYATTFNSCQGLTLDRVGLDLSQPVFSHGQLYTALSRIRNRHHGAVLLPDGDTNTQNITYNEILM